MGTDRDKTIDGRQSVAVHQVILDQQRQLTVTGVSEILRFDETGVAVKLSNRVLLVRGEGLTLRQLTPQDGKVEVRGTINLLSYETAGPAGGLLRRLFG